MNEIKRRSIHLALLILLSSLFFLALYRFDNKYADRGIQPANGLLILSREDMTDRPVRYLINGWSFYPGVLMSPEDLRANVSAPYMVYENIGSHTRFDDLGAKNTPHGSGTYVLHMRLPDEASTYALDLPEIFSAYRLYINGTLHSEMGNPDPGAYTPLIRQNLITFEARKDAVIMLAVSDFSHFYSGLVYPPAFGTPDAVSNSRDLLLGLCIFVMTIGLIAALLSLSAGVALRHKNAILFSFTCILMCCFTSYTLIHRILALPVFPWYALELFSGYLLACFIVVLHNRVCDVGYVCRRLSAWLTAGFALLSLSYGLLSPELTVPVMRLFSFMTGFFKVAMAVYLLITAAISLKRQNHQAGPLFYATVFYASSLTWDRLLPVFEPKYFGWFAEWGSLFLVFAIGYVLWRDVVSAYANSLSFAEEHRQMTRQLSMQMEYSKQLSNQSEVTRRLTHDFRQHLRAISGIAARIRQQHNGEPLSQELYLYLEQLSQNMFQSHSADLPCYPAITNNAAVDALLQYYLSLAKKHEISTSFHLVVPKTLCISDIEFCTVLGNLLENAVEACLRMNETNRSISIATANTGRRFIIQINNTYDGSFRRYGNRFFSRKSEEVRFGIGLESVRDIVEGYGGDLMFDLTEQIFSVGVSLPL